MTTPDPDRPFLVVCLNPTLQRTLSLDRLEIGEVNRATSVREDAAGKGVNVARVLSQLGGRAVHLTHAGGDDRSRRFLQLCARDGVDIDAVRGPTSVRICTTALAMDGSTTTELVEEGEPVGPETPSRVLSRYRDLVPDSGAVILAGSIAPGYPDTMFAEMTAIARRAGKWVLADFRGRALQRALANAVNERPTCIKPNFSEFSQTFLGGRATAEDRAERAGVIESAWDAMERLAGEGITTILTRGARPTLAYSREDGRVEVAPVSLTPVNTIGCGDAVTAGFSLALAAGDSLRDAIERGHAAAAMNATQTAPGSVRPDPRPV